MASFSWLPTPRMTSMASPPLNIPADHLFFFCARKDEKDKSDHVRFRRVRDHGPPHARMGTPHLRLELPYVPGGTQQPPALHNNPACFPIGVATRSRHLCGLEGHCVIGTERSGTGESRKTIVLPLRHPKQTSDIFHLPPTTQGTVRLSLTLRVATPNGAGPGHPLVQATDGLRLNEDHDGRSMPKAPNARALTCTSSRHATGVNLPNSGSDNGAACFDHCQAIGPTDSRVEILSRCPS